MRPLRLALVSVALACVMLAAGPILASGDEPERSCNARLRQCFVSAERDPNEATQGTSSDTARKGADQSSWTRRTVDPLAKFEAEWKAYEEGAERYRQCVRQSVTGSGPVGLCAIGPPPPDTELLLAGFNGGGGPPVLQITPAQAGAIAAARLQIPTVAPGIGPPPDLNRWKMAAVGYPLWLWADGPTHVGPVSDSVAGLNVSLEANVTSLTFRMGDGNTVQCYGVGDKWTRAVEPGTKAPRCGYTYTEPSLPRGNYKVSALTNWAVTWTANGQSGVINVPAVQTTELPVGELQVLVR
jgi:hypothetical protein